MSIDEKLSVLARALQERGVESPKSPEDTKVLDEIDAAIAPLRLPAEIRRFWELVDPYSLRIEPSPCFTGPAFALDAWRGHVTETPGMVPRVLFPVAYESHAFAMVELHGADTHDGGAIFFWAYDSSDFSPMFARLDDLLDDVLDALATDRVRRHHDRLLVTATATDGESLLTAYPPVHHAVHGTLERIPAAMAAWPERWLLRSGIGPDRRQPHGADHTIAEVIAAMSGGPVRARIHATVEGLAGSGEGATVVVSDGTGKMRIWCPAELTALGPGLGASFELQIVAVRHSTVPTSAEASTAPVSAELAPIVARLMNLMGTPDAIAEDVRPTVAW
jgi:hypothetical protein